MACCVRAFCTCLRQHLPHTRHFNRYCTSCKMPNPSPASLHPHLSRPMQNRFNPNSILHSSQTRCKNAMGSWRQRLHVIGMNRRFKRVFEFIFVTGWKRADNTSSNGAGPSARSGHVMTSVGLDLWVNGGYTDSGEGHGRMRNTRGTSAAAALGQRECLLSLLLH